MYPNLFTISGFIVHAYSFFLWLAAITVVVGSFWLAKKRGMPGKKVVIVLLIMLAGAFIGARLLNIAISRQYYQQHPEDIFAWGSFGFSLFGGILLAAVVGWAAARILKIDLWCLGDSVAPFLGLGIALMRLGCFLNGCCFGKVTELFLGVRFPVLSQAHIHQISHGQGQLIAVAPVHPTQLYELVAALVGSAIAIFMLKKKKPAGIAVLSFGLFFAAIRWLNYSFFRVRPSSFDAPEFFYPLFYALMITSGILLVLLRRKGWV